MDAEIIESVHEFLFCGVRLPKPNSSKSGGLTGNGSVGEPSSAGVMGLEGFADASNWSFSNISSNLSSWVADKICCGPVSCEGASTDCGKEDPDVGLLARSS